MIKITKRDALTIPNLMCYFRILLIPVFAVLYLTADTDAGYYTAAAVIGLSGFTDLFDGKIARKFNMVTELGKFLDPVADKLTLGVIALCMSSRYQLMWGLAVLLIVKEGFMAVAGAVMLRHNGRKLNGAMWFGKLCTAVLYLAMALLLLLPSLSAATVNGLILFCMAVMLFTLCSYFPVFYQMWKLPKESSKPSDLRTGH